jgi:preprotein translocase subunit SecA
MMYSIRKEAFEHVYRATIVQRPEERTTRVTFQKADAGEASTQPTADGQPQGQPQPPAKPAPFRRQGARVKRNDPCPCGSGKKFKNCCGMPGAEAGGPQVA